MKCIVYGDSASLPPVLGMECRVLGMLGKHSTTELSIPNPWSFETGSGCVPQTGLQLTILLPLECPDYSF
jgi:hypothetical protein